MTPCIVFLGVIVVLGYMTMIRCDLNLYMDKRETKRLLGIVAELYYVREGEVNDYALSFNIPIPSSVPEIFFTWQSLREPPQQMFYSMALTVSNRQAISHAQVDIPMEGSVPTTLSVFKLNVPCSGQVNTEVDIRLQLNVSIFSASNFTTLNIKRKKTCLRIQDDDPLQAAFPDEVHGHHKVRMKDNPKFNMVNLTYALNPNGNPYSGGYPLDEEEPESKEDEDYATTSTNVFYIAVGCACGVILVIAFVVALYYIRSQKSADTDHMSDASSAQGLTQNQAFLKADTPSNSVAGMSGARRGFTPIPITELKITDATCILQEVHIERTQLVLGDLIMQGTFGRIYLGTLLGEDPNDVKAQQDVYVKTVKEGARADQIDSMLKESCLLKGLCHPNINPILASSSETDQQPLLVFTHSTQGNLKTFLQRCKISDVGSSQTLNTQQLVYMSIHLARGVQYLHRRRLIHRDIATRNCVVDSSLTVKMADTALSRDIFPNDYHCLGDNENRPVKWLAIESLLDRKFSLASDVWAFGVALWELMTLGQQPYGDVDPFEMAAYLQEGYRISQPINCPDELFSVMACCWALLPKERPRLTQLLVCLQDFYTALGKFI